MVVVLMLLVLLENMLPRSRFKFRIRHGMLPRRTMIIVIVCGREQIGESWYRNLGSVFDRIVVFRCVVVFSTHSAGFGNALTLKTTKSNVEMSVFFVWVSVATRFRQLIQVNSKLKHWFCLETEFPNFPQLWFEHTFQYFPGAGFLGTPPG